MKLTAYLNFNGTCESAFQFYAQALEGEITDINRFEDSPMEVPPGMEKKIMHIDLKFGDNQLMGCDDIRATEMPPNSQLMLSFVEVFVMDRIFANLAAGGKVDMELQDTFWGARFGSLTDKFGIRWMFSCDLN